MSITKYIKAKIKNLPYLKNLYGQLELYHTEYPPGHYYSPIPNAAEVKEMENEIFSVKSKDIHGIDLNEQEQLSLLHQFKAFYQELRFPDHKTNGYRYFFRNVWYTYSDAIFLYSMMRYFRPRRIVEVGSGYSSALMLDTNDLFFQGKIDMTFIEPNPQRLMELLKEEDRKKFKVFAQPVQKADLSIFQSLEPNDILFIDSSHVVKTGNDVNHIFFNILPLLNKGVLIHFHDIFYPFEYPKEWLFNWWKGFGWNENYFLKAFLMYNSSYRIILFNTFLQQYHEEWFRKEMPLCLSENQGVAKGASIWIKKL